MMTSTRKRPVKNKKTYKKRGGRKLGEGMSGMVFTPPLFCEDGSFEYNTEAYISKLTSEDVALREMKIADFLRTIDPRSENTVYGLKICKVKDIQSNSDYKPVKNKTWLIIMKNGGQSLLNMYELIEKFVYKACVKKINPDFLNTFIRKLYELGKFLALMNEKGLYHNDISFDNMVWDYGDGNIRFIDFERSSDKKSNKDKVLFMNLLLDTINSIRRRTDCYSIPPVELEFKGHISSKDYTDEHYRRDLEKFKDIIISNV